ncbi:MAG: hypothetical protein ACKV0T_04390 [Planctomycetales bacterium]
MLEGISWLEEDSIDFQRKWIDRDPSGYRLHWTTVATRAKEIGIRVSGHFDNNAALPDARAARRAIQYVLRVFENVDAILLVRDLDDQPERQQGLEQARRADHSGTSIILAVANTERECWVLCGFVPKDEFEERLLQRERQELGANPCLRSEELTACKDDSALRSPKRVLKVLTGDDWERQRECWKDTSLDLLKERGIGNGLTSYLEEIKVNLAPLISGLKTRG